MSLQFPNTWGYQDPRESFEVPASSFSDEGMELFMAALGEYGSLGCKSYNFFFDTEEFWCEDIQVQATEKEYDLPKVQISIKGISSIIAPEAAAQFIDGYLNQ